MSNASNRWRWPSAFTALAPLRTDAIADVRDRLAMAGRNVERVPQFPVAALTTTHSLLLVVLDAPASPRGELGPQLLLATIHDGTRSEHLQELVARLEPFLSLVFGRCADFTPGADLLAYLERHAIEPDLQHIGVVRTSVRDVRDEARLVAALQQFLDEEMREGRWKDASPSTIRDDCLRFVRSHPELPQERRARPLGSRLVQWAHLVAVTLVPLALAAGVAFLLPWARRSLVHWGAATLVLILAVVASGFALIRYLELTEPDDVPRIEPDTAAVEALEDFQVQNQFTMLAPIRDSTARRLAMRMTLRLGNLVSQHLWNRGKAAGIGTIHFARVFRIFDGRSILVLSDYDGSWRRYLADFLTIGAPAIVPIWTHLAGCPKTRFIYGATPGFEPRFLRFTRTRQVPAQLWYSAYKSYTVHDILRAARIREGLFAARTDRDIERWLREL